MLLLLSIAILVLVLLEGFFSGSETAFTSASRVFLHAQAEQGDARAKLAQRMLAKPERFLGTTLMGTNLAVVSSTTLAQFLISTYLPGRWESLLNTLIMTPLILVVGEFIPKSIGRAHADGLALSLARALRCAEFALFVLVSAVGGVAGGIVKLLGASTGSGLSPYVTREDLRAMAELAVEQGLVPETSGAMLRTVFELDTQTVSAIMAPLVDVVLVPVEATIHSVEELAVETGFTRFPVYQGRVDEIIGVVDVRELLYVLTNEQGLEPQTLTEPIRDYVHSNIVYVPETKSVAALLHELRYQKVPMAVVVDEHGGVTGIVTAEDLVEQVVGEIHDERDRPAHKVEEESDSVFQCDGKLEIRDLAEHLGLDIEQDGFETAAGLVLKLAGRIPQQGESFQFQGYEIQVLERSRRRVARLRFRRLPD